MKGKTMNKEEFKKVFMEYVKKIDIDININALLLCIKIYKKTL